MYCMIIYEIDPDCYNKKIITSATSTIFTTTITSQNETTTKTLENR